MRVEISRYYIIGQNSVLYKSSKITAIDNNKQNIIIGNYCHISGQIHTFLKDNISISNYVWKIKDINFEVQQGEALGITGKNGAGKPILLKTEFQNKAIGKMKEIIDDYLRINIPKYNLKEKLNSSDFNKTSTNIINISNIEANISTYDTIVIKINYVTLEPVNNLSFIVSIKDKSLTKIIRFNNMSISEFKIKDLKKDRIVTLTIENKRLTKGLNFIDIGFAKERVKYYFILESTASPNTEHTAPYPPNPKTNNSKILVCMINTMGNFSK